MRFVDLSHTVEHGMVTYPGLPAPVIGDHLSRTDSAAHYDPGTTFQIGRIEMVANTGTYVDALPDEGFRFYAVPVKLRGVGSFPVRAFGLLDT